MERIRAGTRPDASTDTAQPWLADLRVVVRQLRTIPTALREFGVTGQSAYRVHALTEEMLTAAVGLGLPCVESGGSRYFDNLDLNNVSAVLRRPSAWALGQRGWAAGLAALRSGTWSSYELTLAPRCPYPGHRGSCDFSFHLAEADAKEPSDAAVGELISPEKLRVRTGAGTTQAPERIWGVFACLDGADYLHLPWELHHDLDYYYETGLANCVLAADVLLQRAGQLGVRARRSFGLVVLPPFAGLHTWIDFWVDERWVAFDPHLIRFLERAGVLPSGHWPVHESLSGLLLRLAPTGTPFIRHNGVLCDVSFRLARTRC